MDNPPTPLSRRRLLAGLGSSAVVVGTSGAAALAHTRGSAADAASDADRDTEGDDPTGVADRPLELEQIQGNVLAGFHQQLQALVLVAFPDVVAGRRWVGAVGSMVTSTSEVMEVREQFRAGEDPPPSTWTNVALSHAGLAALGRSTEELESFPRAFRAGMAARARRIGDTGTSSPDRWPTPYRRPVHAVVIIAAGEQNGLEAAIAAQREIAADADAEVVHVELGAARPDAPGHEHFGFRDGISQPGLRGFTPVGDHDSEELQGLPGQDLLWPGEFVLGYPRQAGVGGDDDDPGPVSRSGPAWTRNGSFLVFRRLRQDVAGFHSFMAETAAAQGMSEELVGAKLVGRYRSGAPLTLTGESEVDPGVTDPDLLAPEQINDFEFEDDFEGDLVPLAAHIRKTYPRDQPTDDGGEEDTQTHRLLRRGIPFGASYQAGDDPSPSFPDDRGLLFLAYQWSLERQFEHVQRQWVNDPDFPEEDSGQDPVISQSPATGSFTLPDGRPDHVALMQRFVVTTGGEYLLQPSLPALQMLAEAPPQGDGGAPRHDGDTAERRGSRAPRQRSGPDRRAGGGGREGRHRQP